MMNCVDLKDETKHPCYTCIHKRVCGAKSTFAETEVKTTHPYIVVKLECTEYQKDTLTPRVLNLLENESTNPRMKVNTHIVIKREDVFKYLTDSQIKDLDTVLDVIACGRNKDGKKADNSYYICNTDEPYADEVLEVILKAESEG